MLNQNYNCPVEYSGAEGTIQSHEDYPLINYNKSYRWGNHTELGYRKTGGNGTWPSRRVINFSLNGLTSNWKMPGARSASLIMLPWLMPMGRWISMLLQNWLLVSVFKNILQPLAGNTGWTSCGNALPPNVVSLSNR